MKRPGYREAIDWLARNDDCHWLADRQGDTLVSVAAALVIDLFAVAEDRFVADLRRRVAKIDPGALE